VKADAKARFRLPMNPLSFKEIGGSEYKILDTLINKIDKKNCRDIERAIIFPNEYIIIQKNKTSLTFSDPLSRGLKGIFIESTFISKTSFSAELPLYIRSTIIGKTNQKLGIDPPVNIIPKIEKSVTLMLFQGLLNSIKDVFLPFLNNLEKNLSMYLIRIIEHIKLNF
jgi:hypothetical protein